MPANLNKPFDPSCCEGGSMSDNSKSCQPCGCDEGADWVCELHRTIYPPSIIKGDEPEEMSRLKKYKVDVVDRLWNAANRCETEKDHMLNAALGLAAEAGEVADIHKKHFYHKPKDYREELLLELGDVYFYLLKVQDLWGFTTKEILKANRDKLFNRYGVIE